MNYFGRVVSSGEESFKKRVNELEVEGEEGSGTRRTGSW